MVGFGRIWVKLGFEIKIERGVFHVGLQNGYGALYMKFSSVKMVRFDLGVYIWNMGKFAIVCVK